jgi:RNA polymerase sigma-70 factor, ECF subfamily
VEPDGALAIRAAAGDREAFGALVERYQAAVRRLTRAVTANASDADDAAQDAFLSALDRIETYDPSRPFGPWLMRIATNAGIDLVRRRTVRRAAALDERAPARGPSPASDAEAAEIRVRLEAALGELPERQRAAVTLFDVEGYSHAEIAAVLQIPEGTVRSDVFHARRALRVALEAFDPGKQVEER